MAPARARTGTVVGLVAVGFVFTVAVRGRPADVGERLPEKVRLADLITREQETTDDLRRRAEQLRTAVDTLQQQAPGSSRAASVADARVTSLRPVVGLTRVTGPGLRIELRDALAGAAPGSDVNNLVIHSSDVQAVVNAAWRAGAEAIAINGERLVSTSAVLCVGNTLLLNGTVHAPPYVVVAAGASRARFDDDPLVRRLRSAADTYGLGFQVSAVDQLELPAYEGSVSLRHARPA